jgi:hypothetical protein
LADWATNVCNWMYWVNTAPYAYYNPSQSYMICVADNATEYSVNWTINFLDNWFEMYYNKNSAIAFNEIWYINFDCE